MIAALLLLLAVSFGLGFSPQNQAGAPDKSAAQADHHQRVVERGDHVMGFSHDQATHHFRLYPDGGAIEAEANSASDTVTRDQIRAHFGHIVSMFAAGNFSAPMLIHAQNPPGSDTMKRLRSAITYNTENTGRGARIRISSNNPGAVAAVHQFLRFQIKDHQTGDSPVVTPAPAR